MAFWLEGLAFAAWTLEAILGLAAPTAPVMHPDGAKMAYVYRGDVYTMPVTGGPATKVAKGSDPQWTPGGGLAFLNANGQVAIAGGQELTRSPKPIRSYRFDAAGKSVYYLALETAPLEDPRVSGARQPHVQLHRQPVKGGESKRVSPKDWHIISFDISPDGGKAACAVQRSPRPRDAFHVDLHELALATGETKPLVAQPGRDAEPVYSPDGRWIAFHTQGGTWNYFEARHLALVPSGGGAIRLLTENKPFDVFRNPGGVIWSRDSRSVFYTAGKGVTNVLVRQQLETGEAQILTERIASGASFNADGSTAVFLLQSEKHPPEIARLSAGEVKPLTSYQQPLAQLPSFASRVVRWRSSDGLEIEGVLWLPPGDTGGKRLPLLVELHGGPTGVAMHAFPTGRTYPLQMFLQKGIAVLQPNFRGSANYGAQFRLKNALSQGEGDFQDVMTGVDLLVQQGIADPDRLGVMGWSYGGYLTGAVITKTQRFRAASIGAPATDWTTYYGQFDGAKEVLWTYFGGTPWEVPENYNRHSSRSRLRDIKTPALLQVGDQDINHNREIYEALTDLGVPVEYVEYPGEGHAIVGREHQRDLMERNLRWFQRWLEVK